jgi:hypothetical protein
MHRRGKPREINNQRGRAPAQLRSCRPGNASSVCGRTEEGALFILARKPMNTQSGGRHTVPTARTLKLPASQEFASKVASTGRPRHRRKDRTECRQPGVLRV